MTWTNEANPRINEPVLLEGSCFLLINQEFLTSWTPEMGELLFIFAIQAILWQLRVQIKYLFWPTRIQIILHPQMMGRCRFTKASLTFWVVAQVRWSHQVSCARKAELANRETPGPFPIGRQDNTRPFGPSLLTSKVPKTVRFHLPEPSKFLKNGVDPQNYGVISNFYG